MTNEIAKWLLLSIFVFLPVGLILLAFLIATVNKIICKRSGHVYKDVSVTLRTEGAPGSGIVCFDYYGNIPTCKRWGCCHTLEPQYLEEKDWWNSVSMPSDHWVTMREQGYLILD